MNFDFVTFITENWISLLSLIILLIAAIIQFVKTGRVSRETRDEISKGVNEMKYRLSSYREGDSPEKKESYTQQFDREVPEYAYDGATGDLVVVGKKDLQAIVQSSVDCALDKVLEKFGVLPEYMNPIAPTSSDINVVDLDEDLAVMSSMFEDFEDIRSRYNIPITSSYSDMFKKLNDAKADLSSKIIKAQESKILSDEPVGYGSKKYKTYPDQDLEEVKK